MPKRAQKTSCWRQYLIPGLLQKAIYLYSKLLMWTWLLCVFSLVEKKKKVVQRCEEYLLRMEVQATDKEENKQIALSTSKLNYLDPRISVAWWLLHSASSYYLFFFFYSLTFWLSACRCKNMEVPLDKIYNKTLRDKFAWAIDMTENDFVF